MRIAPAVQANGFVHVVAGEGDAVTHASANSRWS
jgi:hypothetical protein